MVHALALLTTAAFLCNGPVVGDGKVNRLESRPCFHHVQEGDSIYNYNLTNIHESEDVGLEKYQEHYHGYNALHHSYKDLVVLGVPCNQFELQEPGNNASEILNGIKYVRPGNGFVPNFQLFKKIEVNGKNENPLYTYLKKYCPSTRDGFGPVNELLWSPLKNNDIRWNFEKFLINKKGIPYMRYDPSVDPMKLSPDIEFLLQQTFV